MISATHRAAGNGLPPPRRRSLPGDPRGAFPLVRLVAHHSGAVYVNSVVYQRSWRRTSAAHPRLDALICADMTTGPAGQPFDFNRRIEEILVRYEPGSEVHTAISKARPYLGAAVVRTLSRLDDQPM